MHHGLHRFLSGARLAEGLLDPALLGLSWIGLAEPTHVPQGLPCQQLHAPCLLGEPVEAWFGARPAQAGTRHGVRYRHDGELLFGVNQDNPVAMFSEAAPSPDVYAAPRFEEMRDQEAQTPGVAGGSASPGVGGSVFTLRTVTPRAQQSQALENCAEVIHRFSVCSR